MADIVLLNEKIEKSGLRIGYIVKQLGLSRANFYSKRTGRTSFKCEEVGKMKDILKLSDDDVSKIFFA